MKKKYTNGTVQFSIRLDIDTMKHLENMCNLERKNRNQYINELIENQYLRLNKDEAYKKAIDSLNNAMSAMDSIVKRLEKEGK